MPIPQVDTKHIFFTGKGGVGKTTIACATVLSLADDGNKVLLISTDLASNIGQVFGRKIGPEVVALTEQIDAIEIDPEQETKEYRERTLAPVRDLLPPEVLRSTEETLSGSCTTEVASLNRFTDFLRSPCTEEVAVFREFSSVVAEADEQWVVLDTASTGHTLLLLDVTGSLPSRAAATVGRERRRWSVCRTRR